MMKKILSVLAIALVMAVSFTGCGVFGGEQTEPVQKEVTELDTTYSDTASVPETVWFDSVVSAQDSTSTVENLHTF